MPPLTPNEVEWHEAVRDALNTAATDTRFFVWINVTPEEGCRFGEAAFVTARQRVARDARPSRVRWRASAISRLFS